MQGRQPIKKSLKSATPASKLDRASLPTTSMVQPSGDSCLQKEFGTEKRWVNWKYEHVGGKLTKIPYGRGNKRAKSNDEATWMTYKEARAISENVGIMALPDKQMLMVDFDNCLEDIWGISGSIERDLTEFVEKSNTYTEVSPSGKGLHLFFRLTAPFEPIAKKHVINETEKIEVYTHGRYFTVTDKAFKDKGIPVRTITPEEALKLLAIVGYPWSAEIPLPLEKGAVTTTPTVIPEGSILEKMFGSKNGKAVKALYDGDTSAYDNDDSAADMALLNHLAFWTQKNPDAMSKIWLDSPLGAREKTQKRKDYRVRSIHKAIENCKEVYEPTPSEVYNSTPMADTTAPASTAKKTKEVGTKAPAKIEFLTQKHGKNTIITQNSENISRILRQHQDFKDTVRMDVFENKVEILEKGVWHEFNDIDVIRIQCDISVKFPFFQTVNSKMVYDAIIFIANENKYDSALNYLKSLTWDKTPRLDTWLSRVYGTPIDKYHKAVGSNVMKGLVMRLVQPGCKFDHVFVIEGPQGTKKSTSLSILGNVKWHVETTMATDSKDFFMQFAGKAIIEFSEGETLSRTEVKKMKAIISMQTDKYRPPYGRTSQEFPRRCIFTMTTNESEYLKDDTGNRRWLPITMVFEEANVKWLKENRDQLYAEAYHRVTILNEAVHEFPKEETIAEQAKRKARDPNTDIIIDWYWTILSAGDRATGITIADVYKVISGGYVHKEMSKTTEMNIAATLRDGLELDKRQVMLGGSRLWRWYLKKGVVDPMKDTEISVMDKLKRSY